MEKTLRQHTDLHHGLSEAEVNQRRDLGDYNVQLERTTKSYQAIVRDNLFTLFNFINIVLAALVFITGNYRNMLFLGVVISNLCIGIIQEIRSKKVLDALSLLTKNHAKVLRDGKQKQVALEEIVLDDILILENGDQIPCDAIMVHGRVECNESLVTGEAEIIQKDTDDFLYSGSFVVSGKCYAQVCAVGKETYVHTILGHAKQVRRHPSQLRDAINFIIKSASITIIPMGILLFLKQLFLTHASLEDAISGTVAGMVGMIPEGLVLLTSVALAVGTIQLARKQTLVQELYCIETLARVDTICFDKTGTLTQGKMKVETIIPYAEMDIKEIIGHFFSDLEDNNATAQALRQYAGDRQGWKYLDKMPFSSTRKASAVTYQQQGTYLLGAYHFLFSQVDPAVQQQIETYAKTGKRVVVLAHSRHKLQDDLLRMDPTLLAVIVLSDPLRPEAPKTLEYFYEQGVDVKIISGDDVQTVKEIAQRSHVRNGEACIDASTLSDEELAEAMKTYTVFGRVTPMQKKNMILALKKQGHITAMSGDGVNDVMALKEADCSIAMAQGSEAAKNIANLVLLDSDFSHLPQIVNEGRRVINNIQRTASLFLVKTTFSVLLSLFTLFFIPVYPFEPIQLTLISTVAIGIPSFFLALEPNHDKVAGNFLVNVFRNALPGALCVVFSVFYVYGLTAIEAMSHEQISTMCVLLAGCSGLAVLFHVCYPFNRNRILVFGSMGILFVICVFVPVSKSWFLLFELSMQQWIYVGIGILCIPLVQKTLYALCDRLFFDHYLYDNLMD